MRRAWVLQYTLALVLLLARRVVGQFQASTQTFYGCYSRALVPAGGSIQSNQVTAEACALACQTNAPPPFQYMTWNFISGDCNCSPNPAPPIGLMTAIANSGGSCASIGLGSGLMAYNIYSTFVFSSCATSLTLDPSDGLAGGIKGLMTAGACWTACAGFLNAYLEGTSGSTFNCFCGNNAPTTSGVGPSCGQSSFYMYSHTPAQAASGLARRKQRLLEINAERVLADNPYCPVGLESCRVFPDLRDEAYECIRTDSELESCGGCRYGRHGPAFTNMTTASGVDCTTLPGVRVGAVTCRRGRCVISGCRYGFRLRNNSCLPITQAKGGIV